MTCRIKCFTLFDITKTGITNRRNRPAGTLEQNIQWEKQRNTQCNFDTIIQAISLRSQPEEISTPVKTLIKFSKFYKFGFLFEDDENEYDCWSFIFSVSHDSVFYDGVTELGALYTDCDSIPMILIGTEWQKLPSFLDGTDELRNIYFEAQTDE